MAKTEIQTSWPFQIWKNADYDGINEPWHTNELSSFSKTHKNRSKIIYDPSRHYFKSNFFCILWLLAMVL